MKKQLTVRREFWGLVLGVLILFGLYVISLYNYLLFHILAELFSIVVACGIFLLAWNSQRFLDNTYLLLIGIAYLFIGATDLMHTLSYKGMGVFQGIDANLPTQLWIAGRYVQSLSFLAAFFFLNRRPNTRLVFSCYTLATSLLFLSIFYWNIFPTCFVEGRGLTPFKIISEYLICLFLVTSILILLKNRQKFDRAVLQWLILSLLATVGSELFFTSYISVYGLSNLSGHFLKILSFYFVYKAIIETGLAKPYTLLFRNLREERDKARAYLDIAGVIFLVINPDQTVALLNKKGLEVLGCDENEIIGKNWFDTFLPKWDRERVRESFTKSISGEMETIEFFESPVLTKSGEERTVAWHHAVLRNEKNQIVGTLNSGEDITKNKEMEGILAHLASFPKLNPNPIVEVDFNGGFHYVNPAARQLFSETQTKDVQCEWFADPESIIRNVQSQNKMSYEREIQINRNWYHQSFHLIPDLDRIRIYGLDITERKRAEESLRESEEKYRLVVENAGEAILVAQEDMITFANPKAVDMAGYSNKELTSRPFVEFIHPEDRTIAFEYHLKHLRGEVLPEVYTFRIIDKQGKSKWVEVNAVLITWESKPAALNFLTDITERKRAEDALRESERRMNRAQEIAHLGSWELDLIDNRLIWSDEVYHIFGLQPQEFGATYGAFLERVHPDDRDAVDGAYSGSLCENRDTYEIEHRVVRKDTNDIRIVYEKCEHFRDATGKIIRSVGMVHDITERKQMEDELRKSRDELEIRVQERTAELSKTYEKMKEQTKILEAFFTSTVTPLVFLDRNFNFVRVNEAYAKACQRDAAEFPGHNHFEFYPSNAKEIFDNVVKTKEIYQAVARPFTFPDHPEWGETYWDWSLTPILGQNSEVEFLVFSLNDVTERTRAQKAQARLTTIIEATSDFVGIADPDGQIIYLNIAARKMLGIGESEDISKLRIPDIIPDWVKPIALTQGIPKAIEEGIWAGEMTLLSRQGREIPISQVILSHKSAEGRVQFLSTIARDITDRKEEERRIHFRDSLLELFAKKRSRKEYLDAVIHLLCEWSGCRCGGVRVLDGLGNIPYESYIGFTQEFWELENFLNLQRDQCACVRIIRGELDPQDIPVVTQRGSFCCGNTLRFIDTLSEEQKLRYRGNCIKNGFLSVAVIPIHYREGMVGAIHLADEKVGKLTFDNVEFIESMAPLIGEAINRFNLEEELRDSENRLRLLSSRLLEVQEQERKRVAHELHDGIGQTLTAVKFKVEDTLQQMAKSKSRSRGALETIVPVIQQAVEEVRRIQMDLRPSLLDDIGILATIGWFTREFQKVYTSIQIGKAIDIQEKEVPDSLKVVIFRVTQEGLNNVAKHSKADHASLSLRKSNKRLELVIADNGQGFEVDGVQSVESPEKGFGLSSMRERTELSGGSFSIESTIGVGTTIRASWPI
jgi:PAS domain S-box-containing protein